MAAEQERARRADREHVDEDDVVERDEESRASLEDVDALLDEIDEVLEENPEDFVRNYVQKGGQ